MPLHGICSHLRFINFGRRRIHEGYQRRRFSRFCLRNYKQLSRVLAYFAWAKPEVLSVERNYRWMWETC